MNMRDSEAMAGMLAAENYHIGGTTKLEQAYLNAFLLSNFGIVVDKPAEDYGFGLVNATLRLNSVNVDGECDYVTEREFKMLESKVTFVVHRGSPFLDMIK